MYQIKCSDGYEIRVIGSGENGPCKIAKATTSEDTKVFAGTYAACQQWLRDRGIKELTTEQHN